MTTDETDRAEATRSTLPPGPRLPVTVQTLLFGSYRHRYLPALRRRYGDTFSIRLAPHARQIVMLSDPDDIRAVFTGPTSALHAGEGNAILRPVMGDHSVLLLDEDEHLRIRSRLMPAFHGEPLRGYRHLIAELAHAEVTSWPTGTACALHPRMQALTLEIILRVVFGVTDNRKLAALRPVVTQTVDVSPIIMLGWSYPRLRRFWPWRRFAAIQRALDRLLYAEIADRRTADLADRRDMLSLLLRASAGAFSDVELRDNLVTLLLAGHETTATALAWAFHELARRPEQQARAQRAADEGDDAYLEAVAKEALRLHPVIYEVARRLAEPVEVAGYLLPVGTTVMPGIGLVQADATYHPDPADFRPERFLDGQPPANTWIPFGGGVRRCLGAGFSLIEATVVLREVLLRFAIRPERARPEPPRSRNVTLTPARGTRVILTRR